MPGNKAPSAFKNLTPDVKRKAMSIFNALMRDGKSEGDAIPIAISRARKGVKEYTVKYKVISQQQFAEEDDMSDEELEEFEEEDIDEAVHGSDDETTDSKKKKKKKKDDDEKNGKKPNPFAKQKENADDSDGKKKKKPNPFAKKGEDDDDEDEDDDEKDEDGDKKKKKAKNGKAKSKETTEIEIPVTVKLDIQVADSKMVEADMSTKVVSRAPQAPVRESAREPVKLIEGAKSFQLSGGFELKEEIEDGKGTVWNVRCIQEGMTLNHTFYSKEVLQESAQLFQGVPCFADHADDSRSVRDVVGWFENSRYEDDGVYAEFHALEATPWFLGPLKEAYARGNTSLIGFSINGEGQRHADKVDGHLAYIVDRIDTIESVDGVINPSAGGEVVKLVASQSREEEEELMALEKLTREELEKARPDLFAEILDSAKTEPEEKETEKVAIKEQKPVSESAKLIEQMEKMQERMDVTKCEADLKETLASNEGLPRVIRDKLLAQFAGRIFKAEELTQAMETEAEVLKALADERPTSYPAIETGQDQKDRAVLALEGLIKGEDVDDVPAARTMREAFAIFHNMPTYDVDAHDVLRESWNRNYTEGNSRLREGVSSGSDLNRPTTSGPFTDWGEVMSELIHKRLLELYAMPYLDDWRKVVTSVVAVPDFKHQRRIRVGGYGTFSSVAEGGTYVTIASPTDEEATYAVTKYGQLERLTLEAVANDDVGAIRRIPEQLARGAKHTLYESVFDIFRTNANVTYQAASLVDNTAFSNSLAGAGTDDTITLGDAGLAQAKRLLIETVEQDSNKRLGLRGKLLLIPPELEPIAMRLQKNEFAVSATSQQGETAGSVISRERDINVHASSFEYLVIPYWANTTHWFFVSDPSAVPMIEVGFYQGKQEPELFVQDMPNVGSNFDADILTYKARLIFGHVVLDHRGVIGSSEAVT